VTALLLCWIAFPLLLGALAQGCGTLVERLAGRSLALGVRIPCGVALIIVVMDLATRTPATARLAVPLAVALGAAGLAIRPPWRWGGVRRLGVGAAAHRPGSSRAAGEREPQPAHAGGRRSAGAIVAGTIVFAVYAAPVVLSGMATWTGYIKLDDTATWLALVDRALVHGRTLAGLPPSSYRATLANYLTVGYPIGSFLPLGIGHTLLGQDIAWLVNPWMAFLAATLALALHRIAALCLGGFQDSDAAPAAGVASRSPPAASPRSLAAPSWTPVAVATLAAQPALLYGYYLWGGIKEVTGAMLVAAFAVTAPLALTGARRVRALAPAAVVIWALIAALSAGGLVWAGPGLVLAAGLWALAGTLRGGGPPRRRDRARLGDRLRAVMPRWPLLTFAVVALAGGAYLVLRPGGFVARFRGVLTGSSELGNLVKPLSIEQIAGIWPTGDFRYAPVALTATHALIGVAALCAAGGVALALRDRRRELVLYVACALGGALLVDAVAAPWLGAKALASASPALPLAALCAVTMAAASVARRLAVVAGSIPRRAAFVAASVPRRLAIATAFVAGGAIAVGIVWSNVLAYHDVNLAPRAQFAELAAIGERIAGEGPTLLTEYQPYGVRHFLREAAPESPAELRMREDPLISDELLEKGESADLDQIQLQAVLVYRTIVLQRSPVASRPPLPYRLTFANRFWEVWQRPATLTRPVLWHLPLGDATHPGAAPGCATVERLARRPGVALLVAAPVVNPQVVTLAASSHPPAWTSGAQLAPSGRGTARLTVQVASAGRYSVWLGGSTRGPLTIQIDGRRVGEALQEIQESGQYIPFGEIALAAGWHTVALRYGGGAWRPGTGGPPEAIGPLVLRREAGPQGEALGRESPIALPPRSAHALCRRTLDWVEGLGDER
jgi:hypothetical protein